MALLSDPVTFRKEKNWKFLHSHWAMMGSGSQRPGGQCTCLVHCHGWILAGYEGEAEKKSRGSYVAQKRRSLTEQEMSTENL